MDGIDFMHAFFATQEAAKQAQAQGHIDSASNSMHSINYPSGGPFSNNYDRGFEGGKSTYEAAQVQYTPNDYSQINISNNTTEIDITAIIGIPRKQNEASQQKQDKKQKPEILAHKLSPSSYIPITTQLPSNTSYNNQITLFSVFVCALKGIIGTPLARGAIYIVLIAFVVITQSAYRYVLPHISFPTTISQLSYQYSDANTVIEQNNQPIQKAIIGKWKSQDDTSIMTQFLGNGTYSTYRVCGFEMSICSQKWTGHYKIINDNEISFEADHFLYTGASATPGKIYKTVIADNQMKQTSDQEILYSFRING